MGIKTTSNNIQWFSNNQATINEDFLYFAKKFACALLILQFMSELTPINARRQYERKYQVYEQAMRRYIRKVSGAARAMGINASVKFRIKSIDSYLKRLNNPDRVISDIIGLRIICPFLQDIYAMEKVLKERFDIIEQEHKGSELSFREFGYDSVHLLVRAPQDIQKDPLPGTTPTCEIQIRTILQDAWAEVEHELVYKTRMNVPNETIKRKLASLNANLTLSDIIFQEIKDWQEHLKRQNNQRRLAFIEHLNRVDNSVHSYGEQELVDDTFIAKSANSSVDNFLLEALQLHSDKKYTEAIEKYSQLLRMKISDNLRSIVYNHRGIANYILNRPGRAQVDFNKAITYDTSNIRAYNNLAILLRQQRRFDDSLRVFEKSLRVNNMQCEGYYYRAQLHNDMGNTRAALKDLHTSLSINEHYEPAKNLLERIEI